MKRALFVLAAGLFVAGCNPQGGSGSNSGSDSNPGMSSRNTTDLPGGASTGQAGGGLGAKSRTNNIPRQ
jgi:hypothetical protein